MKIYALFLAASLLQLGANAFIFNKPHLLTRKISSTKMNLMPPTLSSEVTVKTMAQKKVPDLSHGLSAAAIMTSVLLSAPEPSMAVNGQYGALEGVAAGMIHPVAMMLLYGLSIAAAFQGYKWRSVRTLADKIKRRKEEGASETEIKSLQAERSKLISENPRDKHTTMGSIILGTGVFLSLEGGLSTYWRVGELFFGDHLIAGMGLTFIWALSYALVPLMNKGEVWAKNLHFLINIVGLGLFTWQVGTGLEITLNVWNKVEGW